jgi:hypothetical protein
MLAENHASLKFEIPYADTHLYLLHLINLWNIFAHFSDSESYSLAEKQLPPGIDNIITLL